MLTAVGRGKDREALADVLWARFVDAGAAPAVSLPPALLAGPVIHRNIKR